MKKIIKIFALFDKSIEQDIAHFGDFLCRLNSTYSNTEFAIFKSEKELSEALEQPQEHIENKLNTCEFFLLVLGAKPDEFALERLNKAIKKRKDSKEASAPDIHIFVNSSITGAEEVISFFASDEYEHFVDQFKHIDTLNAKFLIWFTAKEKELKYEVDTDHGVPVIKVAGVPVSGLVDFDALLNNEDYQHEKKKLIRKQEQREKLRKELLRAEGDEHNDIWDEISALAKEIEESQNKITAMEADTLKLYQNYAEKTLASGYNARLKRALECIEQGELDRARKVLDPDGSLSNLKTIEKENEMLAERMETNKKIAEQEINILFAEIDRLKLDKENKNRFEEIEKCYANIEHFQEKFGLEVTVLFDYAYFLQKQNKIFVAIDKYKKETARLRKSEANDSYLYMSNLALILNNLAILYKTINYFSEAEEYYKEALVVRKKLFEINPKVNLPKIATILHNLANLQVAANHLKEAESSYTEALEIRRKLAEKHHHTYLQNYALTLNNLSILYRDTDRHFEAETGFIESMKIFQKLADSNPDAYLLYLANTINDLAVLYSKTNRPIEAESGLIEAAKIKEKLSEMNPDAHLAFLLETINNLAKLYIDTGKYSEAEVYYTKIFDKYKILVNIDKIFFSIDIKHAFENLIEIKEKLSKTTEAEELKKKLEEIKKENHS